MDRRVALVTNIVDLSTTLPKANFSNTGDSFVIEIPVTTKRIPPFNPHDPEKPTHRDIVEILSNAYSTDMDIRVSPVDTKVSKVTMTFLVNSKIPGTGAALLRTDE